MEQRAERNNLTSHDFGVQPAGSAHEMDALSSLLGLGAEQAHVHQVSQVDSVEAGG